MKPDAASQTNAPAVVLRDIAVNFGGKTVLGGVSLRADEHRIAIVGRNGSGKTTLARVMAGLQKPDRGSAEIFGADIARDRKAALRTVGILFQNPDHQIIFPTVEEEITFGLSQSGLSRGDAAREARGMLALFGKTHWAGAATHELSQGQKQLVCLMAVLAMAPALIILDEPYSGLDIPTRLQLMRYVDNVAARVVQITHDPGSIRHFDRVIWLDGGQIRRDGPAAEVLPAFDRQMRQWGQQDDLTHLAG